MTRSIDRRDFVRTSALAGLGGLLLPNHLMALVQDFPVADTVYGRIRGMDVAGIKTFRGIRYGASTAGPNRFMPPRPPASWSGIRDAMGYGPAAPQGAGNPADDYTQAVMWDAHVKPGVGEDCLVLNVWTPELADGGNRPVLFYTHGGGFTSGSGGYPFDGDPMARQEDVVVVTVNHRLGPLGFMNLHDLGWPDEFRYSGVAGVMDLVAALEWVRDNIANFGGNPDNVMIFGQSGGGGKVSTLLAMPSAVGLFHRAAVQSGARITTGTPERAAATTARIVEELGVSASRPEEIQNIHWSAIIDTEANGGFGPILHDEVLPHHPFEPTAPAESATVPLLVGYTREDSGYRGPSGMDTRADLEAWVRQSYEADADRILALYDRTYPNATPAQLMARISTDPGTRRRAEQMAERKADQGTAPVYMYLIEWPSPAFEGRFGAVHGVDLTLVLADPRIPMAGNTPEARKMAEIVGTSFAAFARTGDPNCGLVPPWPTYDRADRATMIYDLECRVENDPTGEIREFWESRG